MLKLRICPKCGVEARSPYSYFCHDCGADLPAPEEPKQPQKKDTSIKKEQREPPGIRREKLRRIKRFLFFLASCFILVLTIILGFRYYLRTKQEAEVYIERGQGNQIILKNMRYDIPVILFGDEDFASFVPSDIDFYLESSKVDIVFADYLSQEFEAALEDNFSLTLKEAVSFLSSNFCFVERNSELKKNDVD